MLIGSHCVAPAGDFFNSQSYLNNNSKYPASHLVGCVVHAPSIPLERVLRPMPRLFAFFQPNPASEMSAPSGAAPINETSPFP